MDHATRANHAVPKVEENSAIPFSSAAQNEFRIMAPAITPKKDQIQVVRLRFTICLSETPNSQNGRTVNCGVDVRDRNVGFSPRRPDADVSMRTDYCFKLRSN